MSANVPILDNGHGGIIGGIYQTPGKRSPDWDKGVLYEGVFNRWVVNMIMEKLDRESVPYFCVSPELYDVSLSDRVTRANRIANGYLISVHANAGGGTGIEIFTSVGKTESDTIATEIMNEVKVAVPEMVIRADWSDGDVDKESDFYVVKNTDCPAVLIECGFMDNKHDYDLLWSPDYINRLTDAIVIAIIKRYMS